MQGYVWRVSGGQDGKKKYTVSAKVREQSRSIGKGKGRAKEIGKEI